MYANWDRIKPEMREAYGTSAAAFLANLQPALLGGLGECGDNSQKRLLDLSANERQFSD